MTIYELSFTPTFLNETLNLPRQVGRLVTNKLEVLREDPVSARGDAKRLKGNNLYRVRVGRYRIFYMLGRGWVKLLSVRKRDGHTYEDEVLDDDAPELLPDPTLVELPTIPDEAVTMAPVEEFALPPPVLPEPEAKEPESLSPVLPEPVPEALPYPLTEDLLAQWLIPREHWASILLIASADDLLNLDIPSLFAERILDNLFPRPIEDIVAQPEYVLKEPEDLERFADGDLSAFLLRLAPEQEAMLDFGTTGPTLVKGGPGTGKSTLAIYRVQRMLDRNVTPILFTTYTNALVKYSEQLLTYLLGQPPEQRGVKVSTVDSLASHYYARAHGWPTFITEGDALKYVEQALETASFPGANVFDQRVRQQQLKRLGVDYLLQEFLQVIEAWDLTTVQEYLAIERRGRMVPLRPPVREALWSVYETWRALMARGGRVLWEQVRRGALHVAQSLAEKPYAALVVDEAQDLTPVALRFLLALTSSSRYIYLAADASQSLYQRGFSWNQIHTDLQVRGRTLLLRRNFRNTVEIAAASALILTGTGAGDPESIVQEPSPFAGELPIVVLADTQGAQLDAIRDLLLESSRRWRLPVHSGAILCHSQRAGREIARLLTTRGIKAEFLVPREIDITKPYVKVLTLHSAKGLEFPFVAVVGLDQGILPRLDEHLQPEEVQSAVDEQRRLFYVGCTRAMRALVVCGARTSPSPFLEDLQAPLWQRKEIV